MIDEIRNTRRMFSGIPVRESFVVPSGTMIMVARGEGMRVIDVVAAEQRLLMCWRVRKVAVSLHRRRQRRGRLIAGEDLWPGPVHVAADGKVYQSRP